ncbi:MAG: NIPSNAP family protein [Pseudomonadota bacterium]|nr:NIPSNAP family protein [Pseudomonadota bacterium]|tara:strand:- start:32 stop:355 length:324 start_codon:yes stop_codon:yes gene_type:complete
MAFYELRQYSILPGKMDDWVEFMETTIIPFQVSLGMVITASFRAEEDESVYIWMRRFESEEESKRLYEAVYQSDTWKNVIGPQIPGMMDVTNIQVTKLTPTPRSTTQ